MSLDPIALRHAAREPERDVWAAVMARAVEDVFSVPTGCTSRKEAVQARKEAIALLTAEAGGWAEQRAMICGFVGRDPDHVRAQVLKRMALHPLPEIPNREGEKPKAPKPKLTAEELLERRRARDRLRRLPKLTPEQRRERCRFVWLMAYLERSAATVFEISNAA